MTVKTLIGDDFSLACESLAEKVLHDYQPDIIVGILTGGGFVGREVFKIINANSGNPQVVYTEMRIRRPGTEKKDRGWRRAFLRYLPVAVLNLLRIAESIFLEYKSQKHIPMREGNVAFDSEMDEWLKRGNRKVLLVDDAIDTGATLHLVKDYITEHYKEAEVRTAVITVTMSHPCVEADYFLFNNHTLVRFPWSNDIKK